MAAAGVLSAPRRPVSSGQMTTRSLCSLSCADSYAPPDREQEGRGPMRERGQVGSLAHCGADCAAGVAGSP